mmetsp:Transcript_11327/g.16709  ORF Transcript_11327/g.16709 Transcript_11327/m.16709 type:complete len:370 (-) Transcript_11327:34-1143(-)
MRYLTGLKPQSAFVGLSVFLSMAVAAYAFGWPKRALFGSVKARTSTTSRSLTRNQNLAKMDSNQGQLRIIDSHLHVWGNGKEPFAFAAGQDPPNSLKETSSAESLLEQMGAAPFPVSGALIVQPINYKFDHSYVKSCMDKWPQNFKGMCLANPSLSPAEAAENIRNLASQGFCAIRFNPYLWPSGEKMSNEVGDAMCKVAEEVDMPIGIMCFKGFELHYDDIKELLRKHPKNKVIIDHFGFFRQGGKDNEDAFSKLLSLSEYPQVYVKTSAFFRVSGQEWPYADLRARVDVLINQFGSDRLMWGSDFPFVSEQCGYGKATTALSQWGEAGSGLSAGDLENIMSKTAENVFGSWGCNVPETLSNQCARSV